MNNPPQRPPTANELLAHPAVTEALDRAWADSQPDDPRRRHEEGGWIYMNVSTGQITIRRAPTGMQTAIDLSDPPLLDDSVIVGKFHTHPNPTSEGWNSRPSASDLSVDERHGVPDLVRADDGVHLSGPESRRGGVAGGPGYTA
jgi:hypothetical protein